MSYQYVPLLCDACRGVARWRGARGGVRALGLPSCAAWLRWQADDSSYDFWPDLAVGSQLAAKAPQAHADTVAPVLYVMQKTPDGTWSINAGHAGAGVAHMHMRPHAHGAELLVSRQSYDDAGCESLGESQLLGVISAAVTSRRNIPSAMTALQGATMIGGPSFIIEIGALQR